jgi:L-ascorbate metabolism protein UlaG (beta-lactamase superfamily)
VFHSGDTGYFPGFRDIGAEHGPFDATMIQIGAYSEFWPDIHMTPEEGLRAHLDLQGGVPGGVLLPIHWGTFNLAPHAWAEPGEWMKDVADEAGQAVALPQPGEPFEPAGKVPTERWWRAVSAPVQRAWRRPGPVPAPAVPPRDELDLAGDR